MSGVRIDDSSTWTHAAPEISVLIPFLRDDPRDLLRRLAGEAETLGGAVEVVVMDDGTGDDALTRALSQDVEATPLPLRLITLSNNEGRSRGRNRLAGVARGRFLLFLDSDMRPDDDRFLTRWLQTARTLSPPVAFGGFSLKQASRDRRFAVHRAMAARSECVDVETRRRTPEKYVYTSNLLVRRDVFETEGFDPAFSGWGWEDVEWAMRVGRRHAIAHVDNPATHMGLDTTEALTTKYAQSAANFARVIAAHPEIVVTYPSYRAARAIRRLPARGLLRAATRMVSRLGFLPADVRAFSLRLHRAALYAEVVPV